MSEWLTELEVAVFALCLEGELTIYIERQIAAANERPQPARAEAA